MLPLTASSGVGRAERAFVSCNKHYEGQLWLEQPGKCIMLPDSAPFARGANLKNIHWPHWGTPSARFSAIEKGFHLPPEHIHVRGRAFALKPCGKALIYTRVHVHSHFGGFTMRWPRCP